MKLFGFTILRTSKLADLKEAAEDMRAALEKSERYLFGYKTGDKPNYESLDKILLEADNAVVRYRIAK